MGDPEFGNGFLNDVGRASCETTHVGEKTAICRESGEWEDREDNCNIQKILQLLIESEVRRLTFFRHTIKVIGQRERFLN